MTRAADAPNPLVGTWKIVSFQVEVEGTNKGRVLSSPQMDA
jgi:hypothetical protein